MSIYEELTAGSVDWEISTVEEEYEIPPVLVFPQARMRPESEGFVFYVSIRRNALFRSYFAQ